MVFFTCGAVFEANAIDHTTVSRNFSGLGVGVNGHVVQAFEFVHQHRIGFELIRKLNDRDVRHDACQVNGGFNTRVATPNDSCSLAFEQRTIAVRAVSHTFVFVGLLSWHVHVAPACTS